MSNKIIEDKMKHEEDCQPSHRIIAVDKNGNKETDEKTCKIYYSPKLVLEYREEISSSLNEQVHRSIRPVTYSGEIEKPSTGCIRPVTYDGDFEAQPKTPSSNTSDAKPHVKIVYDLDDEWMTEL